MMDGKCRWFFPTNHENLKAILSYSLLCGSAGYKKYYQDVSFKHPGYIPVFQISSRKFYAAQQDALQDCDAMRPCLLEIDMSQITPQPIDSDAQVEHLLIAPLPVSCVKHVIFKSEKEKNYFQKSTVGNYGDVPHIKEIVFQSEKELFKELAPIQTTFTDSNNADTDISHEYSDEVSVRIPIDVDYQKVLSYGGMMCMLFYFAKNGEKANREFNALAKGEKTTFCNEDKRNYGQLSEAINNFYNGKNSFPSSSSARIIIIAEVINILCKEDVVSQQYAAIVEKLHGGLSLSNPEQQQRARELADQLESFYKGKIEKKTSDIFGEASSELERLLLYLFHKDKPEKVTVEQYSKLGLGEEEIALSGILAGARFGFNNIHNDLRQYQGLYYYVSYLMAQYAHTNFSKSGIQFKEVETPKTVFEIIEQKHMKRGKKLDFLQWFTKKYDMESCFETKMSGPSVKEWLKARIENIKQGCIGLILEDNSKMKQIERDNGIVFNGIVDPDLIIKHDEYFKKMQDVPIDSGAYEEMLKKCK